MASSKARSAEVESTRMQSSVSRTMDVKCGEAGVDFELGSEPSDGDGRCREANNRSRSV